MKSDLKPLPKRVQWWRKTRNRRQQAYVTMGSAARKLSTLAITVLGAMLISYGAWLVVPAAGFVTGGILCWVLVWSHEQDKRRSE